MMERQIRLRTLCGCERVESVTNWPLPLSYLILLGPVNTMIPQAQGQLADQDTVRTRKFVLTKDMAFDGSPIYQEQK